MKFILGKKIAMTQVFLPSGEVVPVTRVLAGPCTVVLVKKDAVQLGFGEKKEWRLRRSVHAEAPTLPLAAAVAICKWGERQ